MFLLPDYCYDGGSLYLPPVAGTSSDPPLEFRLFPLIPVEQGPSCNKLNSIASQLVDWRYVTEMGEQRCLMWAIGNNDMICKLDIAVYPKA